MNYKQAFLILAYLLRHYMGTMLPVFYVSLTAIFEPIRLHMQNNMRHCSLWFPVLRNIFEVHTLWERMKFPQMWKMFLTGDNLNFIRVWDFTFWEFRVIWIRIYDYTNIYINIEEILSPRLCSPDLHRQITLGSIQWYNRDTQLIRVAYTNLQGSCGWQPFRPEYV